MRRYLLVCICWIMGVGVLLAQQPVPWSSISDLLKDTVFSKPVEPEEGAMALNLLQEQFSDKIAWEKRRECLLEGLNNALFLNVVRGLPVPSVVVTAEKTWEDYQVENLAIEVLPGIWATGNLYRPRLEKGIRYPAILSAQGHGKAEPSEVNARLGKGSQTMCTTLAKMGAIVFNYDMFGVGESGLHTGYGVHRTGLAQVIQTLTSIRIIDYLVSLPEVDPGRIGMTGASGGGTQTFLATAVDQRIAVSVPVVQVSCFFPGGCPCESGRPIHIFCNPASNNAEITALAAPRPVLVVSDGGDWTRTVDRVEYPFIRNVYGYYGKEDLVKNVHLPDEGHDYGPNKRLAMYGFMANHLGLDDQLLKNGTDYYNEPEVDILPWESLLVFPEKRLPDGFLDSPEKIAAELIRLGR